MCLLLLLEKNQILFFWTGFLHIANYTDLSCTTYALFGGGRSHIPMRGQVIKIKVCLIYISRKISFSFIGQIFHVHISSITQNSPLQLMPYLIVIGHIYSLIN